MFDFWLVNIILSIPWFYFILLNMKKRFDLGSVLSVVHVNVKHQ